MRKNWTIGNNERIIVEVVALSMFVCPLITLNVETR